MKVCPVCQKLVNDDTKFCFYCGASLLTPAPEPAAPVEEDPIPEPAAEPVPEPVAEPVEEPAAPIAEEPTPEPVEPAEEPAPESEPEPIPEPVVVPEPEPIQEPVAVPKPEPQPVVIPAPIVEAPKAEVPPTPEKKQDVVVNATDSRSLMTTAGYFFSTILFHIPIIGWIFLFVWGCGRPKNISRKRFALACLIMRLICVILFLSCAVFVLIAFSGKLPILGDALVQFFS